MEIMPEFIPRIFQLQTTMEKMLKFLPEHSFTKIILLRIHTIKNTSIFFKTRTTQKRVHDAVRKSNEAIYTPQEVSIGPIHHGKTNLQPMNTQKRIYLKAFCNRVVGETKDQRVKLLDEIWDIIKNAEEKIRRCYEDGSHKVDDSDRFVKMVLLDAVFILEYLLRNKDSKKYEDDSLLSRSGLRFLIRRDLLLLENQLPFFILEKLHGHLLEDGEGEYTSFRDLAYEYLNRYNASVNKPSVDNKEILHFTDLVRSSLSIKSHPERRSDEPIINPYSATKLHEAAINFKKSRNDQCLVDVTFTSTKGELRIPGLQIDHHTEYLFSNLIALERCHYKGEEYISHYVKLLETLVATPKDAALLIKNKIIDTKRDGASVKHLIDKLSAETFEVYSSYNSLCKQLDQHYQKSWLKNSAYFREVYFGNLWRSTATVSATVLLLSTLYDKRYYPTFLQLIYNYPAVEAKPHPREVRHFIDLVRCSMLIEKQYDDDDDDQ
nr:UPF0481 protein At3g47200-like [Populus alba]